MGQVESRTATAEEAAAAAREPQSRGGQSSSSTSAADNNPSQPSLDSLIAGRSLSTKFRCLNPDLH